MPVELATTTNFTFLTGASHPEEMVERAAELGLSAIAITDRNSLAGVVRAHMRLRELEREMQGAGSDKTSPQNVTPDDVHARAAERAAGRAKPAVRSKMRMDPASRMPKADLWQPRVSAESGQQAGPSPEGRTAQRSPEASCSVEGEGRNPRISDQPALGLSADDGMVSHGDAPAPPASASGKIQQGERAALVLPKLIIGARLVLEDTKTELIALAPDRLAYAALCRLLTLGKRRAGKGECRLNVEDVAAGRAGLILIACPLDPLSESCLSREGESRIRPDGAQISDEEEAGEGSSVMSSQPIRISHPPASLYQPKGSSSPRGTSRATANPEALPEISRRESAGSTVRRDLATLVTPAALMSVTSSVAPAPMPNPKTISGPTATAMPGSAVTSDPAQRVPMPGSELCSLVNQLPGLHLALSPGWDGRDAERFRVLDLWAEELGLLPVAVTAPMMHAARRRQLADILTCIREGCRVEELGHRALPNAERRLRGPEELARLYADHPHALANAVAIADSCSFSLDELRYQYPKEGEGEPPQERLIRLAREGLRWRYPDGVPKPARDLVERELALIGRLDYAPYFLTVHDIVAFARSRGILAQGRGSAANSVTCYALGITEIPPETISMVFERFVSEARNEPPDIDVDFEHERREEVIQHIYERYGRHRAGLCATVIHFRSRAAIREVGKAMGLSVDITAALAGQLWGSREGITLERLREIGLDPADRRLRQTLALVEEIIGFPRHLSQHVGGFIITEGRLDELCPIENAAMEDRTLIEWDKDDIDALGILKVDVLALGMLTCIRKAFDLLATHAGTCWTLATLPQDDSATYDMLCRADSLGVFQVESRAQMNFLPRMRPRCFYDLVIEVAIIRPGPIQGDMVHPYLRRRSGEEEVTFPSPELAEVLGKTLGVPLFQEQAMRIAITAAGFTAEEADRLRRSLATFRKTGTIGSFRERFITGMIERGYDPDFAERCFAQIEGFGEYGFPESHAASFALLVYASAWLKCHHPAVFACALLNSQPMGFYAPAQIVRDAREHGVVVRPVCINASFWDCTLEPDGRGGFALRLGFRQVKGLSEEDGLWIAAARGNGYPDVESLWRRAGIARRAVHRLAEADAFAHSGIKGLERRLAIWEARGLAGENPLPLFEAGEELDEPVPKLPLPTLGEDVVNDYRMTRLSLRAHPMAILRPLL